jgi:purine nucleoside phosphorylase
MRPPRTAARMSESLLGVIGGSGLYELPGLGDVERVRVRTPFGDPSDEIVVGRLGGTRLAFLPRHGRGHRLLPSELPFRANVYAMKTLGAAWLVAVSAVGSLREEIAPGHVVVPVQFIDRTRGRTDESTFFGRGIVACSSRLRRCQSAATAAAGRGRPSTTAASTSAWKGRTSRRARSRNSTGAGART